MKVLKLSGHLVSLVIFAALTSCTGDMLQKKSKIRFVDLQGNPKKITLNTPFENVTALTRQGRVSEKKIVERDNYKKQTVESRKLSYNKYGNDSNNNSVSNSRFNNTAGNANSNQSPMLQSNQQRQNRELLYTATSSAPTNKAKANNLYLDPKPKLEQKKVAFDNQPSKANNSEIIISETKVPAKSYDGNSDLKKGMYVQAGSFTNINHAKKHVAKVKRITNNPRNVNIQSTKIRNKKYYRVVIGPITQKRTADLIIKDLKQRNQNSIVIKIK